VTTYIYEKVLPYQTDSNVRLLLYFSHSDLQYPLILLTVLLQQVGLIPK